MFRIVIAAVLAVMTAGCSGGFEFRINPQMRSAFALPRQQASAPSMYDQRPHSHYRYPGDSPGAYGTTGRGSDVQTSLCGRLTPASRQEVAQCR